MKTKRTKLNSYLLLLVSVCLITISSCRKENEILPEINVQEAKIYVNNNLNKAESNIFSKLDVDWSNARVNELQSEIVQEIRLKNPERIIQTSVITDKPENFEKRNDIRLIVFKNKETDKVINVVYMSVINDGELMDLTKIQYKKSNNLTGKILFYGLDGQFLNGWHYTKGKIDQSIAPSTEKAYQARVKRTLEAGLGKLASIKNENKTSYIMPAFECNVEMVPSYGISCVGVDGYMQCQPYFQGYTYVEYCQYVEGNGNNNGGGVTNPPNGGGNGSGGSNNIPDDPYMPGQDHVAIDPKKYTKCFESIPNAGATYKVIVQVQEPVPGTSFNWAPANGVGHTAITLIKQGSNGMRVTQTLGFYPAGNKISGPSKMVDNSDQTDYTIRMEINMGGNLTDFNKIISGIESPPSTYQLFGMNCTAFVVGVCSMGGITLPNALTTVGLSGPGGATMAMTPGGLGSSMRAAHAQGDSRVASGPSSTGNNPASNGPCN